MCSDCRMYSFFQPNRTLDWILTRGMTTTVAGTDAIFPPKDGETQQQQQYATMRVVAAFAKGVRGQYPPASDHLPILAVIEVKSGM